MNITIDPIEDFNSNNLKLFVGIFEYTTYNNIATNGETEFLHVMKKMIPSSSGKPFQLYKQGFKSHLVFLITFKVNILYLRRKLSY